MAALLAEGECVDLSARVEKGDLEGAVGYGAGLTDELVQPLPGQRSVALVIDIGVVRRGRRLPVDAHAEPDRDVRRRRAHDQVKVAGVKTVRDLPAGPRSA